MSVLEPKFDLSNADAFEWLAKLPSDSVDLTITDPAYESLEKWRATGTTTRLKHSTQSSNDWFPVIKNEQLPELFAQLYRVQKMNTHCYFFCDPETAFIAVPMAKAAGFKFWKPLVWDKRKIGMGYHYRARYELVLFFEKGKRRLSNMSTPDVLEVVRLKGKGRCRCEKTSSTPKGIDRSTSTGDGESSNTLSGKRSTGRSPKALNSTTKTSRKPTIGSKISNYSTDSHTSEFITGTSSEMESGGSRVLSVENSRPSPKSIGTLRQTGDGRSWDDANLVTSARFANAGELCAVCGETRAKWPTEKPVALCDVFVTQSSLPGELVIDPFMGSGAVGVAATRRGRAFAGCDINEEAVILTSRRIKGDHERDAKQLAFPL